jgi:hypothetical protein
VVAAAPNQEATKLIGAKRQRPGGNTKANRTQLALSDEAGHQRSIVAAAVCSQLSRSEICRTFAASVSSPSIDTAIARSILARSSSSRASSLSWSACEAFERRGTEAPARPRGPDQLTSQEADRDRYRER